MFLFIDSAWASTQESKWRINRHLHLACTSVFPISRPPGDRVSCKLKFLYSRGGWAPGGVLKSTLDGAVDQTEASVPTKLAQPSAGAGRVSRGYRTHSGSRDLLGSEKGT